MTIEQEIAQSDLIGKEKEIRERHQRFDNAIKALLIKIRIEEGEQVTDEEMVFSMLYQQKEYSEPVLCARKKVLTNEI